MWDTLLLMVLALVVFGPQRLPKIGRQIGKLMYEFRKASNDFKFQMEEELRNSEEADRRKKEEGERQGALAAAPAPAQLEATASQTQAVSTVAPDSSTPAVTEELKTAETTDSPVDAGQVNAELKDLKEASSQTEPSILSAQSPSPGLSIQPPSTGEKIAADPPGQQPQQRELFDGATGPTAEPAEQDTEREAAPEGGPDAGPKAERSEPAAHNG